MPTVTWCMLPTREKAQGVTVDRTHVLATPGMDRHSAYVALSRHRDGVVLHYGKDDFADQSKLVRALTPDQLAAQISAASRIIRAAEQQSLDSAQATFVSLARELTGFIQSAQSADRQVKWLAAMFVSGIAIGAGSALLFVG